MKKTVNNSNFMTKLFVAFVFLPCALFSQAWIARHGMSPADYQAAFTTNANNGYRLTSVNGYSSNGAEQYIALWEKVSGGALVAKHGMSSAGYQTAFTTYAGLGYRLTSVSGYAVNNVLKFAAIWEQKAGGAWVAKHNMTATDYQTAFTTYAGQGYRLQHISGYVVNGVEYFAAIWEQVAGGAWVANHNMTAAQYQTNFTNYSAQGYVLKKISGYQKNGTDLYAAIWEKTSSPLWSAKHGVSALNYQHVFDNYYYQGYRPKLLNAFASGTSAKFNSMWTNSNMSGTDIANIDAAATGYMSSQSVSGLSLAICKDGRLVFAKAYGSADPATGENLSPNHPMRIMSISKSVTSVGIMTLIQKGLLSKDAFVFGPGSILGSKYSTPANKPSLNRIRVRQLLWHTSGLNTCNGESVFWDASKNADDAMAVLLGRNDLVATDTSVAYLYSNTNFFILARIIEQVSGQSYENYVRQNVLNRAGIGSSMYVGNANGSIRSGEAHYTPMTNMNLQLWGGFGGWVARPIDLLKFLNRVDGAASPSDILTTSIQKTMTTGSPQNMGYGFGWGVSGSLQNHNGCHGSSRSFLVELANGVSYAVIINSAPTNDGCGWTMKAEIEKGLAKVLAYPSYNLFDNIGSGRIEAAEEVSAEEATVESSDMNAITAYPKPSLDGSINFSNASSIKSITVIDVLGNKEVHPAAAKIQTLLKGLLILQIETEQGKVIEKVVVE